MCQWWDSLTKLQEPNYRSEVVRLVRWCNANNLSLSVGETTDVTVDFR